MEQECLKIHRKLHQRYIALTLFSYMSLFFKTLPCPNNTVMTHLRGRNSYKHLLHSLWDLLPTWGQLRNHWGARGLKTPFVSLSLCEVFPDIVVSCLLVNLRIFLRRSWLFNKISWILGLKHLYFLFGIISALGKFTSSLDFFYIHFPNLWVIFYNKNSGKSMCFW